LGFLGEVVSKGPLLHSGLRAAIGVFALWVLLVGFDVVSEHRLGPARQTHPAWARRFGRVQAAFLWGLDLGTGLTTQSTYVGYWLLPLAVLAAGQPAVGLAAYLVFSLTRSAPVVLGPILPKNGLLWVSRFREPMRQVNVLVAATALLGLVTSIGMP
jgi:hypothetical protein